MSELTLESVGEMEYHEMKKTLSELGLNAVGTKVELTARLQGYVQGSAAQTPPTPDAPPVEPPVAPPVAQTPPESNAELTARQANPTEERKASKALKEDQKRMKAQLDAEPKRSVMIPFMPGEDTEEAKKVPFHVNLNGYAVDYPRGVLIEVPESHYNMIQERLESEGTVGNQWKIGADPKRQEALS